MEGNPPTMTQQTNRTVPVTMPDWMWGRLATIAEFRKVPIADLIARALTSVVEKDPDRFGQLRTEIHAARVAGFRTPHSSMSTPYNGRMTEDDIARISELRDQGYSDSTIAADMGISRYKVQYHRTRAGIPPHRPKKEHTP